MNRAGILVALLACAAMGASATLHAQARGPAAREMRSNEEPVEKPPLVLDEISRARKIAEMEAWLGRLVGLFRVDTKRTHKDPSSLRDVTEEFNGSAKCSGIGEGPGVRCIIREIHLPPVVPRPVTLSPHLGSVTWPKLVQAQPILYFGINPDTLEIHAVVVDIQWVAAQSGMLTGDTVNFSVDNWKVCQLVLKSCWAIAGITAEPAGEIIMKISATSTAALKTASGHTYDMELHLHREIPVDAAVPPGAR